MDIIEGILSRKSIRGFKPDPVPKELLRRVLEVALRSPSAENGQPWEITVIAGSVLDRIKRRNVEKLEAREPFDPDVSMHIYAGIYKQRHMALAAELYGLMGISREDREKRAAWVKRGFRFYDAPAAIVIAADRSLDEAPAQFDIGCLTQTICLAALGFGLGTCIAGQGVLYPEVVREFAGIPASKRLVISIAIGYPDPDFPANSLVSKREPVDSVAAWLGFD